MNILHHKYLPFPESELKNHFISNAEKHFEYYNKSVQNYKKHFEEEKPVKDMSIGKIRQIEKDEKFWTVATFMTLFNSKYFSRELTNILKNSFDDKPPLKGLNSWSECLNGQLEIYFEPSIPSPKSYKKWLKNHIEKQQLIPYVLDKAKDKEGKYRDGLEGRTNLDAMIINTTNGFAVMIEAKVLSDISNNIYYDMTRNQLIRNIDVMLEKNEKLLEPLNKRDPEKSLFLLVTPKKFKVEDHTRLYGHKYKEYTEDPKTLARDMPHRYFNKAELNNLSSRIGWTSWEEIKEINNNCCPWLNE